MSEFCDSLAVQRLPIVAGFFDLRSLFIESSPTEKYATDFLCFNQIIMYAYAYGVVEVTDIDRSKSLKFSSENQQSLVIILLQRYS